MFAEDATRWIGLSDTGRSAMDDPRCRIAAIETEDSRCKGLLDGAVIEMEDPRCVSLLYRGSTEMDDPRCRSTATEMEDPRCRGLQRSW
jgi:hypothetical protein